MQTSKVKAPLPGANYTSDTRNYPWHRPPDITDYDEGIDYIINRINDNDEEMEMVYAMLGVDTPITSIVNVIMLQGIAKGKFPIDLAIMMAGPVARYIQILADANDIKYDLGIDDNDRIPITPTSLRVALGLYEDEQGVSPEEPIEPVERPTGGLMAAPTGDDIEPAPEDEQAAMLGMMEEEEPTDELA